MSNNKASSNNESIILNEPILDRREDSSEVYSTGDERIINRTITIQAAIKSTLPDYLKIFITNLALGACFFASSNEYMKVNKKTKESIIIIKNLERFSLPIIIKTLEATNIMITERIGHQKPEDVGQIIQQSYILGVSSSIPVMMFLLLGNKLWSEEVNNYFQIYALSIPAFAIAETNIQAIVALGRYKQVMGIGLLEAALIFGLTHGLTNGIEISNKTIINKQGNKGLPLAMAISHVVLALMITIWMHCDKSFDKYKLKRCEHCYTRVKQIKKLIRLGIPLAIKEIATNSYELVFTAILVKLGSSAELMASITDQAFMLMEIPLIATSRTLTQKLGIDYGKWKQSSSVQNNQVIQNNVKNQIKASLTIQYLFLAIPMSTFIIAPDKVTRLCESLSDSQNSLNQEQQNDLNLIIQILTIYMLIHSFSHISNSVCNSFQNTFTPMLLEFLDCALNSAAGWFFLKEKGLVAIDIGYIPTEFLNLVLLIYVANKIINNIKNPFNAPPTEELNIQGDNSTVVLQVAHQDNPEEKKMEGKKRHEDYCAL